MPGRADRTPASPYGPASHLLLTLHGRLSPAGLRIEGDRAAVEHFLDRPDLG